MTHGSMGKQCACDAGDTGDSGLIPGSGRSLEKEMGTHSSVLAWEIPCTEEPGGLQSSIAVRHKRATKHLGHRTRIREGRPGPVPLLTLYWVLALPAQPLHRIQPTVRGSGLPARPGAGRAGRGAAWPRATGRGLRQ